MQPYQKEFIDFALHQQVLRFGEFQLKSGRKSPYFFNAGLFNSGLALSRLGSFYAQCIQHHQLQYDLLFGPAYKGIPLVASTSVALARDFQQDKAYAFNRKEAKQHGEGGSIVGAALQGKVLIVDDVITAGTAIRQSLELIAESGAQTAGILVALDRQERGQGELSAIQEIERDFKVPVHAIIRLTDLIEYLDTPEWATQRAAVATYRASYGI